MNIELLDDLIRTYTDDKDRLDTLKKTVEGYNTKIKDIMTENDLEDYVVDNLVAKKTVSYRTSLDEDKLLDIMLEKGYTNVIKTKQYVDADLLEHAIYHGEIDKDTLIAIDDCTEKKEVVTLKITKKKGK